MFSEHRAYLAERDEDHLGATLVLLLVRLALQEAHDVRRDDLDVGVRLRCLLLLFPVDDVADGEDAGMAGHFKVFVHLDEAALVNDTLSQGLDEFGVRLRAEGLDLMHPNIE